MEDNRTESSSHSDDSDENALHVDLDQDNYRTLVSAEKSAVVHIQHGVVINVMTEQEVGEKLDENTEFYEDNENQHCDICKESVPQDMFKTHLETHNAFMMYECDLCQKVYKTVKGLKMHHAKLHSDQFITTLTCGVCGKDFADENSLIEHREKHNRERPYVCHICEKDFASRKNFRLHYRRHQESKPYVCDICNRGFVRRCQLRTHGIIHTGEKPYICNVCTRGFTFLQNLNRHMITHAEGRVDQYECGICYQKFDLRNQLREHMLTHPGEKPFPCDLCLMSFTTVALLKRHYCTHTGEKPYYCCTCNLGFVQKVNLQRHCKTQKHLLAVKESASS